MKQIELLARLQEIENNIDTEKEKLKRLERPRSINKEIEEHKKIKNNIENHKKKIAECSKMLKRLENDLKDLEYKANALKEKMYGGKISDLKQLGLMLKEQEKYEGLDLEINKEIEAKIEELESLESELKVLKVKDVEMYKSIRKKLKDRKETKENCELKLESLLAEREEALISINEELLENYNYIKSKKSNPIAILKGNICSGCHMDLPIMTISKLHKDDLVFCSNCGRILYNPEGY